MDAWAQINTLSLLSLFPYFLFLDILFTLTSLEKEGGAAVPNPRSQLAIEKTGDVTTLPAGYVEILPHLFQAWRQTVALWEVSGERIV